MTEKKSLNPEQINELVVTSLEDMKALDIQVIDVRNKTSVTDYMIVATGTSSRHVKSIAELVVINAKEQGLAPIGTEGEVSADWVLVDLNDSIVHVMLAEAREFYALEKLWTIDAAEDDANQNEIIEASIRKLRG